MPVWLRLILLLVAAETLRVAIGLFNPALVNSFLPWPSSPLNGRFIAALYGAVGLGLILCQAARSPQEVRILLAGALTASSLILSVTIFRLIFDRGEIAAFPTLWLCFYIIDPLLSAFALRRIGWTPTMSVVSDPSRAVWRLTAIAFGLVGLASLLAPSFTRAVWPWAMTEPQSQLYGSFFLAFAVASALASWDPEWLEVRWPALMIMLLAALVLLSSLLHLGRFTGPISTPVWFGAFSALLFAFAMLTLRHSLPEMEVQSSRERGDR